VIGTSNALVATVSVEGTDVKVLSLECFAVKGQRLKVFVGNPSHSYGASPAVWDHTFLFLLLAKHQINMCSSRAHVFFRDLSVAVLNLLVLLCSCSNESHYRSCSFVRLFVCPSVCPRPSSNSEAKRHTVENRNRRERFRRAGVTRVPICNFNSLLELRLLVKGLKGLWSMSLDVKNLIKMLHISHQ